MGFTTFRFLKKIARVMLKQEKLRIFGREIKFEMDLTDFYIHLNVYESSLSELNHSYQHIIAKLRGLSRR